jgi:hypothetical protein
MADKTRIGQIHDVLSKYPRRGRNELMREICIEQKLMSPQTFQNNLDTAVEQGLISKKPDTIGKVRRVWYSVRVDMDELEIRVVNVLEKRIIEYDSLFEAFLTANPDSAFIRGTVIFLFQRLLIMFRIILDNHKNTIYGESSTYKRFSKSIEKWEQALDRVAHEGSFQQRKDVLGIIGYQHISFNDGIINDIKELLGM